jgi:hypothetical protein
LIDFGRFQTTSEKIPEAGLFHGSMLRGQAASVQFAVFSFQFLHRVPFPFEHCQLSIVHYPFPPSAFRFPLSFDIGILTFEIPAPLVSPLGSFF